jgi:hypothetical protein
MISNQMLVIASKPSGFPHCAKQGRHPTVNLSCHVPLPLGTELSERCPQTPPGTQKLRSPMWFTHTLSIKGAWQTFIRMLIYP